ACAEPAVAGALRLAGAGPVRGEGYGAGALAAKEPARAFCARPRGRGARTPPARAGPRLAACATRRRPVAHRWRACAAQWLSRRPAAAAPADELPARG